MSEKPQYQNRPPSKPRGDVWWGESIVTDEVREALAAADVEGPNRPVPVILELVWDQQIEVLAEWVKAITGIEVPPENRTDRFLQAQLTREQIEELRRHEEADRQASGHACYAVQDLVGQVVPTAGHVSAGAGRIPICASSRTWPA